MEKPKITDYDFNDNCDNETDRPCEICESEKKRYQNDIELWDIQQVNQANNFWMVAGGPAAPRKQHINYELAHNEAKRLAEKHPGTVFYVVRPVTKVLASPPKAVSTPLTLDTTKWL
jgi:hypothetical protein